jgi:hypothetical protein
MLQFAVQFLVFGQGAFQLRGDARTLADFLRELVDVWQDLGRFVPPSLGRILGHRDSRPATIGQTPERGRGEIPNQGFTGLGRY